jgi:amidophosphoribosyltransferase
MCGIIGIVSYHPVQQTIFDALTVLQHRGQDAAGIMTSEEGGQLHLHKNNGLVRDVFRTRHMTELVGHMGIGHVRYPTLGTRSVAEAQPFYVNSPYGIGLAHNGTLTNAPQLKSILFHEDLRHINTRSDSEVLLNVLAHELNSIKAHTPQPADFFKAVEGVHQRCRGAYASVVLIAGHGILAFRDPYGIRPLIYGKREEGGHVEYMVASESVALTTQQFKIVADVAPGQAIFIDTQAHLTVSTHLTEKGYRPCLFEFVYLARPDSVIDKISVYKARLNIGRRLAEHILTEWPTHNIDVVIPIPETSRSSAIPVAQRLRVKYREGFVKNRYIGRTFIMPGQTVRRKSVQQKLSALALEFEGKNVLLVDDSIVRGTTSREIIHMAREAGANKVYFASASPPVRYPNLYGINMPTAEELVAHNRTVAEIAESIGADKLFYLPLEDLVASVREGNSTLQQFESSIFDGQYCA